MIIEFSDLPKYAGAVAMVDGSFDPIHEGHIAYFEQAASLGLPVLCNVAADNWTVTKHPVLLSQEQRGVVLNAIKYLTYVHLSRFTTSEVLSNLKPKKYVKGNDWLHRGGVPDNEKKICDELGIEIVYLDTSLNSSSRLLAQWQNSTGNKRQDHIDGL